MRASQARHRDGLLWLLLGLVVIGLAGTLSALTGNWRILLDATPLFMVSFALGLILLTQPLPPKRPPGDNQDHASPDAPPDAPYAHSRWVQRR